MRAANVLREDIVEKALKRNMTAFYKVRRILELERLFLYLCYHDGGILDLTAISQQLDGVTKQTAASFMDLFEATHLVYRLKPYGYGKEVLRGRDKIYLADAALPGAVTLQGRKLLSGTDNKPGDSCTAAEEGYIRRNASAAMDVSEITLICNGTTWESAVAAGSGPGNVTAIIDAIAAGGASVLPVSIPETDDKWPDYIICDRLGHGLIKLHPDA